MEHLSKLSKQELLDYIQKGGYDKKSYFDLVEEAPYAIFIHDFGTILYLNKQALEIIDEDKKENILHKNLYSIVLNEKKERLENRIKNIIEDQPQPENQIKIKTQKGNEKTLLLKSSKFIFNGKPCLQTFASDITQEEKTKKELNNIQNSFDFFTEKTDDVFFKIQIKPELKYVYISSNISKIIGYEASNFYNDSQFSQKIQHPQQEENTDSKSIVFEKPFINKILHKNQTTVWLETVNTPILSENNELIAIQGITRDITEWVKNKEEIIQQREGYKQLLQKSPFGILIHDGKNALYANDFILKMINASSYEKAQIKDIFYYILPEYHEAIKARISNLNEGKEQPFFEFKAKINEKIVDLEIKSVPVFFDGKQAIQVIINDPGIKKELEKEKIRAEYAEELNQKLEKEIKEKTKAEKQLTESKQFIESIINSSLDMIIAVDNNDRITEFNNAAQKTFGYTKEEILGKKVEKLFSKNSDYNLTSKILDEKWGYYGEIENIRKDGTTFISIVTSTVLKNNEGEKLGVMGLSRDITSIKQAEQKITTQTAKLNSIFQNTSHSIFTVDKNFKITSFNKNFVSLQQSVLGITPQVGMEVIINSGSIYSKEEVQQKIEIHKKAMEGVSSNFENEVTKKNGQKMWLETYVDPIVLEKNKIEEATYIVHDITEKKHDEQELKESLKEKEILLKEVHHRVKNNLQVISSIINLQSSFVKDMQSLDMLKDIQNRIKTMSFIHESLYQRKEFSSINFSEYIANLSQNLVHSFRVYEKKIDINVEAEPVFLNLDQSIPCGLIINELVTNAFKYAFLDKEEGEVKIKMQEKNDLLVIEISDNGVGMPTNIDFKNTESLGLQLVITLIEQLSGKIELKSKKGTKFIISFANSLKNKTN